jgi:hypothetical protein
MQSLALTQTAVANLCEDYYSFPILKATIKRELVNAGFDAVIMYIADGQYHLQFQSDEQLVMFKLKYSELM